MVVFGIWRTAENGTNCLVCYVLFVELKCITFFTFMSCTDLFLKHNIKLNTHDFFYSILFSKCCWLLDVWMFSRLAELLLFTFSSTYCGFVAVVAKTGWAIEWNTVEAQASQSCCAMSYKGVVWAGILCVHVLEITSTVMNGTNWYKMGFIGFSSCEINKPSCKIQVYHGKWWWPS